MSKTENWKEEYLAKPSDKTTFNFTCKCVRKSMRGTGVGICEFHPLDKHHYMPKWIKNYHCKRIPFKLRPKIKRALIIYFLHPESKQELEKLTKYVFGWMPLWKTRNEVVGIETIPITHPMRKLAEQELAEYLRE